VKPIRILGIQMGSLPNKKENLRKAVEFIEEGAKVHPELDAVCLPELFYEIPTKENKDNIGEPLNSIFSETFSRLAKKHKVNIISGSFPQRDGGKLFNTVLVFNRKGEVVGDYSKTHLFDALDFRESDTIAPGNKLGVFELDFAKIGVIVCYELRFPELIRTLALEGIDILFVPAAFFSPRHDHWEILTKAAALQNLIHVVAVNQFGPFKNAAFFGRSGIVDPWGVYISRASDKEGYFYGEIDLNYQTMIREKLPVYKHRREDLYK